MCDRIYDLGHLYSFLGNLLHYMHQYHERKIISSMWSLISIHLIQHCSYLSSIFSFTIFGYLHMQIVCIHLPSTGFWLLVGFGM